MSIAFFLHKVEGRKSFTGGFDFESPDYRLVRGEDLYSEEL